MNKYIILSLLTLFIVGCKPTKPSKKPQITVSIAPLRYFTEQIVGQNFNINTMVPKGGNPETYEPTPQQMVQLSQSKLFVKVGSIGFEMTWIDKLMENAPQTIIIDTSKGIDIATNEAHHADKYHYHGDPHTWMSATNAKRIALNIYNAVVKIDEKNIPFYRKNLDSLLAKIDKTNELIEQELTKKQAKAFLIYHPTLTYFARDYGLTQIIIEQEGREPSASQLQKTIEEARKRKAKTMFIQREFMSRNTQIVAQSIGATIQEINPLSDNWHEEMKKIAEALQ